MSFNNADPQHLSEQSHTEQFELWFFLWKKRKKKSWLTDWNCMRFRQVLSSVGGVVFPVTSVSVFVSQRQEKTKLTLLLLHIYDPLRFAVRERLILRACWFYSSYHLESLLFNYTFLKQWWQHLRRNLALRADRGLPGLTFAGQESFTARDKNASDLPDCGNNCGNLWSVPLVCKRFAFEW